MKTLVCTTPGHFSYESGEKPLMKPGHTLLRIRRVGICGSDLHAFEGTQPFFTYPRILGHELAAEIVETDGAPSFEPGEAVTFLPYFHCGHCLACRAGKTNCCVSLSVCGIHEDGGMAEFLLVPSYTLIHGDGLSFDELALVEPLSIGAHAVTQRAQVQPGEWVLVVGAGPIGLGVIEFARIAGANIIVLDVNAPRLAFCRDRLGIEHALPATDPHILERISMLTNGDMPTVVMDATGSLRAINDSFRFLAYTGRYVLVGLQKGEISVSHPDMHRRENTLMSSRNATRADFEYVVDCLKKKLIDPKTYITHRVAFGQVRDAFASWLKPETGVIKAMVELN